MSPRNTLHKAIHLAVLFLIIFTASSFAQAPEKMSYQAVVRDSGDALVTNQAVGMQISILQTTATGTAVYVETHTKTTNVNGLVTLEIGTGTPVTGTFAAIELSTGTFFIKTETDPTGGTSYTITGTSQLLSVPYALHAKTVTQPTYTVNTFYAELGGYVFWVSANGKHGLVAETVDQGLTGWWYNAQNLISNPSNHSVNGQKFRDWRMPTKHELNEMYSQKGVIGSFAFNFYWSSTEFDNNSAWLQDFSDSNQLYGSKYGNYYVRSVRAF
ncbi:DUF1566 domain-containing protein [Winogradskyella sp.]|nr:DUF1566 domain-containing protein [Winogradskyella sp.]